MRSTIASPPDAQPKLYPRRKLELQILTAQTLKPSLTALLYAKLYPGDQRSSLLMYRERIHQKNLVCRNINSLPAITTIRGMINQSTFNRYNPAMIRFGA